MNDSTILVVDDDPSAVEIVRTYLEARGYRVATASDGREALAKLEEVRPALVLLDVMMPGMDGWEVARIIKNHPVLGEHVRRAMPLAGGGVRGKQERLRAGADDYIVITCPLEELGWTVERDPEARRQAA